jgi:DNA-binding beta-propeller fold protein YncE
MPRFIIRLALPAMLGVVLAGPARADVLVTNYFNNTIEAFNQTTGSFEGTFISDPAHLALPAGILYNPADNLIYVSSQGTNAIVRYNLNGSYHDTFINLATINPQYGPAGLRFSPTNGDLYVTRNLNFFFNSAAAGQGTVDRFDKTTGSLVGSVMTGMTGPTAVQFTPSGDLFGASFQSLSPSQSPDGLGYIAKNTSSPASPPGSYNYYVAPETSTLVTPAGMSLVPGTNNLAVVDLSGGSIHQYGPTSAATGTQLADLIAPGGALNGQFPSDVLFTSPTTMWVATLGSNDPPNPANGSVMLFDLSSATPQTPFMTTSGFFAGELAIAPLTSVPEPGTLLLVGGALAAGIAARRRNRS